jgi:WD40 repeat protein
MTRLQSGLLLAAILVSAPAVPTGLEPPARAGQQERDEIVSLIARLGSPEFGEREAATGALDRLGGKALAALRAAATDHADAEVRRRAAQLAQAIEQRLTDERSFRAHEGGVYQVAFSPDGRHVLSSGYDGERRDVGLLRLWEADGCKEVRRFAGKGIVYALAVAPDGKRVATGAQGGDLCLWDLRTGKALRRFPPSRLHVMALALSPAGRWLLSGSNDGKQDRLQLWNVEAGGEARTLAESKSPTYAVAFLPDGRAALSAGKDGVIRRWDVKAGREVSRLEGHTNMVTEVAVSPDGRLALSSSWDKTVRLWDLEAGREVRRFLGHADAVRAVKFTPDGRRALSASHDGTVRLWDVETGRELRRFPGPGGQFAAVAVSPDGKRVVSGSMDGMLRLWRLLE